MTFVSSGEGFPQLSETVMRQMWFIVCVPSAAGKAYTERKPSACSHQQAEAATLRTSSLTNNGIG